MHKRHTLHGAAARPTVHERFRSSQPPGESGTRIRRAGGEAFDVRDTIQASLDSALAELDLLEIPYRASAPPLTLEPAQQMPRGMPPLPFRAPHPHNMPPLPSKVLSLKPQHDTVAQAKPEPEPALDRQRQADLVAMSAPEAPLPPAAEAVVRPGRWLMPVALTLGLLCLVVALLLHRG